MAGEILFMLAAILAVDVVAGLAGLSPRLPFGPAAGGAALARALERRLDRKGRSARNRIVRGALVVLVAVVAAAALGAALESAVRAVPHGLALEGLVVLVALGQRAAMARLGRTRRALAADDQERARRVLARGGLDPGESADKYTLARLAIEDAVRAFAHRVVGAAFWYLLAGLAGLLVQWAVNGLASVLGSRAGRGDEFALAAARLDAALGYLPERIGVAILVASSLFVPGASPDGAARLAFGRSGRAAARAGCLSLAAVAGALGLALGGPRRGGRAQAAWIGDGRARAGTADMRRAAYLLGVAGLIGVGAVVGLLLALTR